MAIGDVVPEIALVVAAVAALLLASFVTHERQGWCALVALIGLGASFFACVLQFTDAPKLSFSGAWVLDGAAIWARLLIAGGTALVVTMTPGWMRSDRRHGEYYALLLLSAAGAMLMAGAADLLELSVGVLLSSITGYTLAAYHRAWSISVEAGVKYFLIGAFANTLLMIGVTLIFGMLGSTRYDAIAVRMSEGASASPLLVIGAGLTILGIAFKMGAVPVHSWMPDVAEGAPAPSAAFLTVVPKIGAAVALARVVMLFPVDLIDLRPLIAVLAALTMTLGNLAALWQSDLRRLLGWSSVSQSGYALVAVAVIGRTSGALPALIFFLLGYAAANLTAFAVVTHLRGRTRIEDYAGLWRQRPWVAFALILALFSLVGIPPLGGFVGKLTVFLAAIDGGYGWLAALAVANTVASLFYYLRVIGPAYFAAPGSDVWTLSRGSGVAVLLASALIIALGVGAALLLSPLQGHDFLIIAEAG
ncbi:NADH-quinone oxidoreductase subunit L [Altererythrobacter sp. B11]|uniref:NADH-quinone oxidoreductase subunit N n=1 Tax=Altererythrobacter sp. B11 TaxID=2060312 RepID=UPI000DC6D77D|nr:NADH-quinone oxidoreductase subunit N [Altererythrobacter sp. B11]BBC71684.1 NADH-quinone oxidoreductase subunit L [Altererythrobacter sp. B11]